MYLYKYTWENPYESQILFTTFERFTIFSCFYQQFLLPYLGSDEALGEAATDDYGANDATYANKAIPSIFSFFLFLWTEF